MKIEVATAVQKGNIRLLFASEAYSMGTDVSDIERIVHAGPPHCLESEFLFPLLKKGPMFVLLAYITTMTNCTYYFCMNVNSADLFITFSPLYI